MTKDVGSRIIFLTCSNPASLSNLPYSVIFFRISDAKFLFWHIASNETSPKLLALANNFAYSGLGTIKPTKYAYNELP